ncbi:hypothetical protein DPMN_116584 [Dreissena polymorpha]|uniref:Uncharacterized protein n=2 Tax=Dreissena polymorpha TaxID=45954 RepID=A0A9D4QUE9_DREPO|nr:hypothetical protein DPMN_116584 [Dreissena polymorpha]
MIGELLRRLLEELGRIAKRNGHLPKSDSGFTTSPEEGRSSGAAELAAYRTDGADLEQRFRPRFRRGGPRKILEVSQDSGTQCALRAGKTVPVFRSTACDV